MLELLSRLHLFYDFFACSATLMNFMLSPITCITRSLIVVLITLFNIEYDCSAYIAINFLRWTYSFCNINDTKILLLLFSLLFVDESVSIRFFEGCTIAAFCCCFSMAVSLGTCSASMSMKNKMPFKSKCINQSYLLSSFLLNQKSTFSSFFFFRSEI